MKAKFLSVLLALTMVLSLLPTAVLALDVQSNEKTQAVRTVSLPEGNTGDFTIDSDNAVLDGTDVTYMNGTITVTGNNVTIQNLTFGDKAKLVVNTKGKFTLNKCTFAPETASDNNGFVRNPVKLMSARQSSPTTPLPVLKTAIITLLNLVLGQTRTACLPPLFPTTNLTALSKIIISASTT